MPFSLKFCKFFLPLLGLLSWGANGQDDPKKNTLESDITQAINALGINMLNARLKESPTRNACVSPLPITSLCTAAAVGANGETQNQLLKLIYPSYVPDKHTTTNPGKILQTVGKLNKSIIPKKNHFFSHYYLYVDPSTILEEPYVSRIKKHFGFYGGKADFKNNPSEGLKTINTQVEQTTKGKIKNFLSPDEINKDTRLVMFNILAFSALWNSPFDRSDTQKMDFYTGKNKQKISCPFMFDRMHQYFVEKDQFSLIWKSYKDTDILFTVILPKGAQDLPAFLAEHGSLIVKEANKETCLDLIQKFNAEKKTPGPDDLALLYLPKFTTTTPTINCSPTLKQCGVTDCFLPGIANFAGISKHPDPLYIRGLYQKNFFSINEFGTQASSVSSMEAGPFGGGSVKLLVNRPFLYGLLDEKTGVFLFLGAVNNPVNG